MLIKNDFEVAQPIDKVWTFFDDIPAVAACLPGAELTEDLGDDKYRGKVAIRMGPVKLQFAGNVAITERDNAGKRIVVDAAGADEKGRGQAAMLVTAKLMSIAGGTKIHVEQDLQLSGAAVDTSTAAPAGGFAIGVRAAWMALCRVARRFFMPYQPTPS